MAKRKLPIGIQTFADIVSGEYYYVDKTPHLHRLVEQGKYFFLSRPRRFGKSLLLDTLKSLFEGRESLFRSLYIHDKWDWQVAYPVIRISFADGVMRSREDLDKRIRYQLRHNRERLGLTDTGAEDIPGEFADLIALAHDCHGQRAVVLVDEYDKPILDNITEPDRARELREGLKNLYSVLKDADPRLQFCFLTGVSKFNKVSLFSGLNNLNDITLAAEYATICGYTDSDVDGVFADQLGGFDRDEIRRWYNGYRWGDMHSTTVYNPFDVLLLFQNQQFAPYWFESATPTFLVKLLAERSVYTPALAEWQSRPALLSRFDVDQISTEALLFQTGYLTLTGVEEEIPNKPVYRLGFPNYEVESSLNEALLPALGLEDDILDELILQLPKLLRKADMPGLETYFKALYAGLPHDWYRNNPIARYEGHYASVFYSHFAALGLMVTVEDATHRGRVDMTVDFAGRLFLFEFKVVEQLPEGSALLQLKAKGYADKYRSAGKPIHLVGVEFSRELRQVVAVEWEQIPA